MPIGRARHASSYARLIAVNLAVFALILCVIEGFVSVSLFVRDVARSYPLAERRHTRYDPELGWVSEPDVHIPDMYGPGVYLRTNHQGFRNSADVAPAVPDGKRRIICSGDSFTLGFGVNNDEAWCQRLASLSPRIEAVNMGQGGYGLDQTYLWFKRDGSRLEHHLHLVAFVTDDFWRMQIDSFSGYAKPVLRLKDNTLVVTNVPVPRPYRMPSVAAIVDNLESLRSVELLLRFKARFADHAASAVSETEEVDVRRLAMKIFEDLKHTADARGSRLALVRLPTRDQARGHGQKLLLVDRELERLGIPLIDVLKAFQSLPDETVDDLFFGDREIPYPGSGGHLNARGNAFTANVIAEAIRRDPALADALDLAAPPPQ